MANGPERRAICCACVHLVSTQTANEPCQAGSSIDVAPTRTWPASSYQTALGCAGLCLAVFMGFCGCAGLCLAVFMGVRYESFVQ